MKNEIKALLPYVGCKAKYEWNNELGVELNGTLTLSIIKSLHDENGVILWVKLLLRPIESLTDEEAVKMGFLNSADFLESSRITIDQVGCFLHYQYLQSIGIDLPSFYLEGKTLKEAGLALYI